MIGSPDPDGRQIDGMGGGISSLSKVVVLSIPGETLPRGPEEGFPQNTGTTFHPFPDGIAWADDVEAASKEDSGWDVVYRFAQVGVRDRTVDWGSTCGNLVAAVAHVCFVCSLSPVMYCAMTYSNVRSMPSRRG